MRAYYLGLLNSTAVADEMFCRGGYAFSLDSFDHDTAVGLDDHKSSE